MGNLCVASEDATVNRDQLLLAGQNYPRDDQVAYRGTKVLGLFQDAQDTTLRAFQIIQYNNGDRYEGELYRNIRDGKGVFISKDKKNKRNYEYTGEWKDNQREGRGTCYYYNDDLYIGEWRQDCRYGFGELFFNKYERYKGEWRNDKKEGEGVLVQANNGKFVGRFKQDKKHGRGAYVQPDGKVLEEIWHLGVLKSQKLREDQTDPEENLDFSDRLSSSARQQSDIRGIKMKQHGGVRKRALSTESKFSRLSVATASERFESTTQVDQLLKASPDVSEWTTDQVKKWLETCKLSEEQFSTLLKAIEDDRLVGSQLLSIQEDDLMSKYQIDSLGRRKHFMRCLYRLKVASETGEDFSDIKSGARTSHYKSYCPDQSTRSLGSIKSNKVSIAVLEAAAGVDNALAVGEETGLIESLHENGFEFYIDFAELEFNANKDFIAGGGYGDVYHAKWLGTQVAVKRFSKRYQQKKALKEFIKEIEMLHRLRHPNIVLYMGVSIDPKKQFCMVTEFVNRGSLFDLLHKKKIVLNDKKIFSLAKQVAMALNYLHKNKLLHCDLKSQNVLINQDWKVKLCDFGLSRYQEKFENDNHGKIGTPHWMAPEILRQEKYTESADVYSYGVILWEMLTGKIPYHGRSIAQITGVVGFYGEKLKVPDTCNKSLRKIVNNCMIFEPEQRPSFEHIVQYLDKKEHEVAKQDQSLPVINKLYDFLN